MQDKKQPKNVFDKVFDAAASVKQGLLDLYAREGAFIDKENMDEKGILSNAIGLTGVMLLLIAFCGNDDGRVFTEADKDGIAAMLEALLPEIRSTVEKDGYLYAPIISKKETQQIFSAKEKHGSTDTATWVLSLSSLVCFAKREKILNHLSEELLETNYQLLKDSLQILLDSQRSDGTWGFGTWEKGGDQAEKSLYFSYSVSVSIADFLYYIRGDVKSETEGTNVLDNSDAAGNKWGKWADAPILDRLTEDFGENVLELVLKAREGLQLWLLRDCLPLMPKLASCVPLTKEENEALGIWEVDPKEWENGYNYYQLYYTFYLIDMLIGSEVDLLFESFDFENAIEKILGGNAVPDLSIPGAALLADYRTNPFISSDDKLYYFGIDTKNRYRNTDQHIGEFFSDYLQQSLHSARAMYTASKRTRYFWKDAMLKVRWYHDDDYTNDQLNSLKDKISDPAFVPMALRANTVYVYYISKKPDFILDHLFDEIMQDAFDPETLDELPEEDREEKLRDCVSYLWDTQSFNLFVTERSVEALVDYFDYIRVFEPSSMAAAPEPKKITEPRFEKSEFELAVEKKIREYLQSDSGKTAIAAAVTGSAPQAAAAADPAQFLAEIKKKLKDVYSDQEDPEETLQLLVDCYDALQRASIKREIRNKMIAAKDGKYDIGMHNKIEEADATLLPKTKNWLTDYVVAYLAGNKRMWFTEALEALEQLLIDNM